MSKNYSTILNPIKIRVGKYIVGEVRGNIFHKTINGSKHMLKKPPAIAFDISSLDNAERVGASWVHIRDRETGITYNASIDHIRRRGFEFDRGFGDQIALPMNGWIKTGQGIQLDMFQAIPSMGV